MATFDNLPQHDSDATRMFRVPSADATVPDLMGTQHTLPALSIVKGPQSGMTFELDSPEVTLGRDPKNEIFLNDMTVSRRHAQLTYTGQDWSIEDLNSTNGTLVNNRRINRCPLRDGDLVTFGLSTFEFRG